MIILSRIILSKAPGRFLSRIRYCSFILSHRFWKANGPTESVFVIVTIFSRFILIPQFTLLVKHAACIKS